MKLLGLLIVIFLFSILKISGQNDELVLKSIFNEALSDTTAYHNLRILCKSYKGRITGTPEAGRAVDYICLLMNEMGLDRVEKQPVKVPRWVRGEKESASILSSSLGKISVPVSALGMSVGTGGNGLTANVVEVLNFKQLEELGREKLEGKIVFYNRPMDPTYLNTFAAYGEAGDQRSQGAIRAATYGATGVVVRSLTTASDNFPHTGVMRYADTIAKIPAVAISTRGADLLGRCLKEDPELQFTFKTGCSLRPDTLSFNVIGEIKGTVYPDEIITVGGHLDAWDTGEGAHDDGAGCMQSLEVLRIFRELGIKPKRTIRSVMFMDEEVLQTGGKEYAKQAGLKNEKHWLALESDRGGLLPLGFGISVSEKRQTKLFDLKKYFEPYKIDYFVKGGGGVDINPLRQYGTALVSFIPDWQRYFDYHHSGNDTFEQVNFREFQLGSAAIASFIYLADKYDL